MSSSPAASASEPCSHSRCKHCSGELIAADSLAAEGFCCPGCKAVHHTIGELGLSDYYELLRKQGESPRKPSNETRPRYEYCNDALFIDRYTSVVTEGGSLRRVSLYLEGMHCAACVWLLEKLPLLNSGIIHARVEFGRSVVTVQYEPEATSLGAVCSLIHSLGYQPVPVEDGEAGTAQAKRHSHRIMLLRIGVAAVCSMNIMMMAVSLYQGRISGITPEYAALFSWVSLVLALPVVLFCAYPFYRTAWGGLKAGVLHVDLPIALAIVAAFVFSAANTLRGEYTLVYYDSLAALTLLLLGGRWLQSRSVERITDAATLLYALSPRVARSAGGEQKRFVESLVKGDLVEVRADEVIPVDGTIVQGDQVLVHQGILTGESVPIRLPLGAHAFAGTTVVSGTLTLRVSAVGRETRLGRILQSLEQQSLKRAPIELFLDRVSKGFTALVLIAALGTFLFWAQSSGYEAAFTAAVALLVVSCPCVLAVATPLTFSVALMQAAKRGILIKSAEVIERLTTIRTIVFDKTGTLTEGAMKLTAACIRERLDGPPHWVSLDIQLSPTQDCESRYSENARRYLAISAALEQSSHHPIAVAVRGFAVKNGLDSAYRLALNNVRTEAGIGVWGELDGELWGLVAPRSVNLADVSDLHLTQVRTVAVNSMASEAVLLRAGVPVLWLSCSDAIRSDAREVIERLRSHGGLTPYLLSGDQTPIAHAVAAQVAIPQAHAYGDVSPEEKRERIAALQSNSPTAMVGDGVNDAAALTAASVGIGVHGGAQVCLSVADVYLTTGGVKPIADLFEGAGRTLSVVRVSLWISGGYNLLGAVGAIAGVIGPLEAAILMPISSVSVILIALLSRKF